MVHGGYGHMDGSGQMVIDSSSCTNACKPPNQNTQHCNDCRAAFDTMGPTKPFIESNVVPYEMAVATQGIWGPIRPGGAGCTPVTECSTAPADWQSAPPIMMDPECRTEDQQIDAYMAEIIGGNPLALVEVD
jgi:hypothetical protein